MSYKNIYIILFSFIFLFSCASQPVKVETPSGKPEAVIKAPLDDIKSLLISRLQENNWVLVSDSKFMSSFTSSCLDQYDAFRCSVGQALIGNSYSTTPVLEMTLSWTEYEDKVRVMVTGVNMSTQMAFGQVNRQNLLTGSAMHNDLTNWLKSAKVYFEGDAVSEIKRPMVRTKIETLDDGRTKCTYQRGDEEKTISYPVGQSCPMALTDDVEQISKNNVDRDKFKSLERYKGNKKPSN
jgi:hypothetical protein